jgi:twitching motility two-component system response regulator PilH
MVDKQVSYEVLVIDDDPTVLEFVTKVLEPVGFNVHTKTSVPAAIAHAEKVHPHLILTDLNMNPESGYSLLERKSKYESTRSIPIVVFSGKNDFDSIRTAISLGAADYILKPVDAPTLVQKVQKSLKVRNFNRYEFPRDNLPMSTLTTPAEIVSASSTGLIIASPIKIAANEEVDLEGPLVFELGIGAGQCHLRSSRKIIPVTEAGRYLIEVSFFGINDKLMNHLRGVLRKVK